MKNNIHPKSIEILASCTCGNKIKIFSTICKDIQLDVCAKCHPFYTGKQRLSNIGGRIEKFKKKFSFSIL